MNQQPPEKRVDQNSLEVHSIFYTIQGEGPFSGRNAVFIRLTGCNLQCPGCDTEYTSKRTPLSPTAVVDYAVDAAIGFAKDQLVVITGGEPFRQNITQLCLELIRAGAIVQIETNGTLPPSPGFATLPTGHRVFVVCSPKTPSVNPELLPFINAYKYVIDHNSQSSVDGLPIQALELDTGRQVARPHDKRVDVYIQPYDAQNVTDHIANQKACVKTCLAHGHTLQLQIHKLVGVE